MRLDEGPDDGKELLVLLGAVHLVSGNAGVLRIAAHGDISASKEMTIRQKCYLSRSKGTNFVILMLIIIPQAG